MRLACLARSFLLLGVSSAVTDVETTNMGHRTPQQQGVCSPATSAPSWLLPHSAPGQKSAGRGPLGPYSVCLPSASTLSPLLPRLPWTSTPHTRSRRPRLHPSWSVRSTRASGASTQTAASSPYRRPSHFARPLADPAVPSAPRSISPNRDLVLYTYRPSSYTPILDLARPELKLAGGTPYRVGCRGAPVLPGVRALA